MTTPRARVPIVALLLLMALLLAPPSATFAAVPPMIVAGNAIVLEPDSGRVFFNRASTTALPPASLTKIMTALVALEHADPAQRITIVPEDLVGEASMGLRAGEQVSLTTLLYGLLLPSGNDAATAIARGVGARGGDASGAEGIARFVGWMNEAAARLNLPDTHYVNPHGLDAEGHRSSAADLARLTSIAWTNPTFARIFGSASYQGEGHGMRHGNRLIGQYDGVVGGKTGLTDGCGFCLITAATHGGHRLVVVVLQDTKEGAFADTVALLGWVYAQIDAEASTAAGPAPATAPIPATIPGASTAATPPPTTGDATRTPQATTSGAALPAYATSGSGITFGGGLPSEPLPFWEQYRALLIGALAFLCAYSIIHRLYNGATLSAARGNRRY